MDATADKRPATRAEARALSHPLRLRILRMCLDAALTNRELAERLGEQPGTVLYHIRTLVREGFLVREAERRGRRQAREFPYRSTRKSLTLKLGLESGGHLAMIDAARAELAEARPDDVLTIARLGSRLRPDDLAAAVQAMADLIAEATAADHPDGEPVGIFVMAHRRGG
jgi:DNA-binding transcriptional ArsR family regulator